jgi:Bacterial Ig domain
MEFKLIREPEMFNWSGNPVVYAIACSPYSSVQSALDIRIQFTLQVETSRGTDNYQDIKTETLTPGPDGVVQIDVSSLADAYLKYNFPTLQSLASGRCDEQSRYYRLKWRYFVEGVLSDPEHTDTCVIMKGGLPYDGLKITQGWSNAMAGSFLSLNTVRTLDPTQPHFASFLYIGLDEIAQPSIRFTRKTLLSEIISIHTMPFDLKQGDIFYVPLQKLTAQADSTVYGVTIDFFSPASISIQQFEFEYEARRFFKVADLLFINSIGGTDSIRFYGELGSSGDYEQSLVNLGSSSGNGRDFLPGKIAEASASVLPRFSGNTGFINKQDEELLEALMLNKLAYQVTDNNFLRPVIVTKKTLARPVSTAFLSDAQVEWTEANRHSFFSQLSMGNFEPTACPALIFFTATQETSTTLRIAWSCPAPYNKIQVKVSNGTPAEDITGEFTGEYGSGVMVIPFSGSITVQGRLFCGYITNLDGTIEPSLGPADSVAITLVGNRLPAAINDQFELSIGHSTPQLLAGNLLTNDFDPDGDAIEVIAASGPTLQGGWYTISADGKVYYTAPYPSYTGTDRFDYKIKETLTGIESDFATVFITLVSGTGTEVVYAKVVLSNPITGYPTGGHISDVFIKTFANALCTIPKDVSLLGISFNYVKRITTTRLGGTPIVVETTHAKIGTGVQTLVFSGVVARRYLSGIVLYRELTEFILQPGSGYIIV